MCSQVFLKFKMIRKRHGLEKSLDDKVVEVSFSSKKSVELKIGEKVNVSGGDKVLIEDSEEYVEGLGKGMLSTYAYEGNKIVYKRRALNNGVINRFDHLIYRQEYYSNYGPHRKIYDTLKGLLEKAGIFPKKN